MTADGEGGRPESASGWAHRYVRRTQTAIESILRPYDLGPAQWFVLDHLAREGTTTQRDLWRLMEVERTNLTGVVGDPGAQGTHHPGAGPD